MKKNLKSLLAISLASILTISLGTTSVYAGDISSTNVSEIGEVRDIILTYNSTFFLFEDSTLWMNDGLGNFIKVYENVKSITEGDWSELYLLLNDGTLLSGNIFYEGEEIVNTFEEIASDVRAVAMSYDELYIIKNDDTLWYTYLLTDIDTPLGDLNPSTEEVDEGLALDEATVTEATIETSLITSISYTTVIQSFQHENKSYDFEKVGEGVKEVSTLNNATFVIDNNDTLNIIIKDENAHSFKPIMDNVEDVQLPYYTILIQDKSNNVYELSRFEINNLLDINSTEPLEPTLISSDVKSIESTENGYFLLKEDDTLWSTGSNYNRDLGFESYESYELNKIDENVVAVYNDGSYRTIYLKKDGSYWGMGDNYTKALGIVPYAGENYFDEDGKRYIMDDVSDMFLTSTHSVITKTDHSLWKLGTDISNKLPSETELSKIADDVSFATGEHDIIKYVAGENNDLYFSDSSMFLNSEDYEVIYYEVLKSLGYDVEGDDITEVLISTLIKMTSADMAKYESAYNEYIKENYGAIAVASDVNFAGGMYYINSNDSLYEINQEGENELIAENVMDFALGEENLYIINPENELLFASFYETDTFNVNMSYEEYMKTTRNQDDSITGISAQESFDDNGNAVTTITTFRDKDSLDFEPTGITNVKDIKAMPFNLSILDLDGVLKIYSPHYQMYNFDEIVPETIVLGNKTYTLENTYTDVVAFDCGFSNTAFINSKNELWAIGANYSYNLGDSEVVGEYVEEPIKLLDNVAKVSLSSSDTLILTTDKKLYGMGQNANGELGFKPQGSVNRKKTVYYPTELTLNFLNE